MAETQINASEVSKETLTPEQEVSHKANELALKLKGERIGINTDGKQVDIKSNVPMYSLFSNEKSKEAIGYVGPEVLFDIRIGNDNPLNGKVIPWKDIKVKIDSKGILSVNGESFSQEKAKEMLSKIEGYISKHDIQKEEKRKQLEIKQKDENDKNTVIQNSEADEIISQL